jgi:hypothetical protein
MLNERRVSMLEVYIMKEAGYNEAMTGLSLSHGVTTDRAKVIAPALSQKDGGHNKFLEAMIVWLNVNAPRHWWQEADTYRIATKQSESTMHTIHKGNLEQGDFEMPISDEYLGLLNLYVHQYQETKSNEDLMILKNALPEGFMQRRIWVCSYKTLRNIVQQRYNHRQPGWSKALVPYLRDYLEHPEFLPPAVQHD